MSNEESDDENIESENPIGDVLGSDIPDPIKKNFLKVVGQLCTSAVEIPTAYLEGVAAEKRAETNARIRLIEKSANEIAAQMEFDPEYAREAVKKFGQRVIKEQINLDRITNEAAKQVSEKQEDAGESTTVKNPNQSKPIDDDWLNIFEKEASQKSTEEMQSLFSKILAGEVQSPDSYSIRTIKLLGELDVNTARLFSRFCSCCMVYQFNLSGRALPHIQDARICALGKPAGTNSLQEFGFSYDQLNVLTEYGLIIPELNSRMDYGLALNTAGSGPMVPFKLGNGIWLFFPDDEFKAKEVHVLGPALSKCGSELLSIVPIEDNLKYVNKLQEHFESRHLRMVRVSD